MRLVQGDEDRPISNEIVPVSVRHIAWELLATIDVGLSWSDGYPVVAEPVCPLPLDSKPTQGRNDPCPCGSGRKLKKCLGRREPLQQSQLPPGTEYFTDLPPDAIPNPIRTMGHLNFTTSTEHTK